MYVSKVFANAARCLLVISASYASGSLQAIDHGCTGRMREILELGGQLPVAKVESINAENSRALFPYSQGATAQSQLASKGSFGFVAIRREEVVGFVICERRGKFFNIISIAVANEEQRQGVGRDLVDKVIEEAKRSRGIEDVRVLIASDDTGSSGFFSAVGLTKTEVIPQQFENRTKSGLLFKYPIGSEIVDRTVPQLLRAPQPVTRRRIVTVATIPATLEFLRRVDPTIANSGD